MRGRRRGRRVNKKKDWGERRRDGCGCVFQTCLVSQRLDDLWVAVALVNRRVRREKVKVLLAIDVPHLSREIEGGREEGREGERERERERERELEN